MKKKYIIILLLVIVVVCLIFIFINITGKQSKSEELEALSIFEKNATIQVIVDNSIDNTNDIQRKLENIKYVKNAKLVSKEDALEDVKNKIAGNLIGELFSDNNIFPNSFIITLDVNDIDDLEKAKNLENDIRNIEGISNVNSSGFKELMEVYEKAGIKGMREYDKILTIMDEQGINGVNTYLDKHEETRKILKDFIHF